LAASIEASARRLNAIAADRAPTMATTIQPIVFRQDSPCRQLCAKQREWQRKERMLDLDHLERHAQASK
jgi:hypothetical protein